MNTIWYYLQNCQTIEAHQINHAFCVVAHAVLVAGIRLFFSPLTGGGA